MADNETEHLDPQPIEGSEPVPAVPAMSLLEFQQRGYLQEVNRQFLHPLGLALMVSVGESSGLVEAWGIVDYRHDPEGIVFDEITPEMVAHAGDIATEWATRIEARNALIGNMIQPLTRAAEEA